MSLQIVPYYGAALAILFLVLSLRVVLARRASGIAIGVEGRPDLQRRVQVHANFAEYVPFVLLLLAMAELRGADALWLHGLCIVFLVGRLSHAWGVSRTDETYRYRMIGMASTFGALLGAAILIVCT